MNVVVLDDLVVDHILSVDALPIQPDQHQMVHASRLQSGGAANTLIMGARLGLGMHALGTIGADAPGDLLLNELAAENVDTAQVIRDPNGQTRVVFTLADKAGRHVFLGLSGVTGPRDLPQDWQATIRQSDALFFDGWGYRAGHPLMFRQAAVLAGASGVPLFFDPGPEHLHFAPAWLQTVLSHTRVLLSTEDELRGMSGADDTAPLEQLARQYTAQGIEMVVVKRGEKGSTVYTADAAASHSAFSVPVRDTSGAGDAAAAMLIYAYLHQRPLDDLPVLVNAAGGAAVGKLGAGRSVPTCSEIEALLGEKLPV